MKFRTFVDLVRVCFAISCCVVVGCAGVQRPIAIGDLQGPSESFLVDRTKPDDYPGFLMGEGNDLGCRYGIHHESVGEFSPPKVKMFEALLLRALPDISSHRVVLERFDVYYNARLRSLDAVGKAVGGVVGEMSKSAARTNIHVFTFEKLLIDADPEVNRYPDENQVGCDNYHEGEYYPSEISGGHDVVVTWLKFSVDDRAYYFRTFYQFQAFTKTEIAAGIEEAIQMSVQGIAQRVEL